MTKRNAKEVAGILKELLDVNFGGKEKGRYKISIERLLELSGQVLFSRSYMEELEDAALEEGILLINIGSAYAVLELSVLKGYRNVPPHVVQKKNAQIAKQNL